MPCSRLRRACLRRGRAFGAAVAFAARAFAGAGFVAAFCQRRGLGLVQRRDLLGDLPQRRVAAGAGARPVAVPHVRRFLQQDVAERAVALHAVGRERGDVDGAGPLVLVLDQQPRLAVLGRLLAGPPRPPALGAHEHPGAFQLEAVERHLEIALGQRRVDVVDLRRPGAAIPQHHHAGAVALRDHALELAVLDRVILDVHRQPLVGGVDGRALRHRPRQQHAVVLDAEVVVQRGGQVLLDAEEARLAALGLPRPDHGVVAGGLRRAAEVALLAIRLERHSVLIVPASPASRYAVACHDGRGSRRERAGLAGPLGSGRSGGQGGAAVGQRRRHAPAVGQGRVALDRRRRGEVARLARRHRRRPRAPARAPGHRRRRPPGRLHARAAARHGRLQPVSRGAGSHLRTPARRAGAARPRLDGAVAGRRPRGPRRPRSHAGDRRQQVRAARSSRAPSSSTSSTASPPSAVRRKRRAASSPSPIPDPGSKARRRPRATGTSSPASRPSAGATRRCRRSGWCRPR